MHVRKKIYSIYRESEREREICLLLCISVLPKLLRLLRFVVVKVPIVYNTKITKVTEMKQTKKKWLRKKREYLIYNAKFIAVIISFCVCCVCKQAT